MNYQAMQLTAVKESFEKLKSYCEQQQYKGWDPYDGLSSGLFNRLPFIKNNRFCRLAWIQLFKRSPVNLRPLTAVKKQFNAKGLGLFLTAYCNLFKNDQQPAYLDKINYLAKKLIDLQSTGYSGSCWGYYFPWQARAFYQPAGMPTVVATSFVADALFNAYEITRNEEYLQTALSSSGFVLNDLNRIPDEEGNICFSYSPLDQSPVFNASLLGARLLSRAFAYTGQEQLKETASKAVAFVCRKQQLSGAWSYGLLPFHQWVDNFHTGFNLECIFEYQQYTGDKQYEENFRTGMKFYLDTFFCKDGKSKYYADRLYPIDIHAPAQLMVTLIKTGQFRANRSLADRVLDWTLHHMQSPEGYFYYQQKKYFSSRIPYMRWAQAWMFYAMSYYLKETRE